MSFPPSLILLKVAPFHMEESSAWQCKWYNFHKDFYNPHRSPGAKPLVFLRVEKLNMDLQVKAHGGYCY